MNIGGPVLYRCGGCVHCERAIAYLRAREVPYGVRSLADLPTDARVDLIGTCPTVFFRERYTFGKQTVLDLLIKEWGGNPDVDRANLFMCLQVWDDRVVPCWLSVHDGEQPTLHSRAAAEQSVVSLEVGWRALWKQEPALFFAVFGCDIGVMAGAADGPGATLIEQAWDWISTRHDLVQSLADRGFNRGGALLSRGGFDHGSRGSSTERTEALRELDRFVRDTYVAAANLNDFDTYAALYAADALWSPPGFPDRRGPSEVRFSVVSRQADIEVEGFADDAFISGEFGYVSGAVRVLIKPVDVEKQRVTEFYRAIWILQRDGAQWRIRRQVWANKPAWQYERLFTTRSGSVQHPSRSTASAQGANS